MHHIYTVFVCISLSVLFGTTAKADVFREPETLCNIFESHGLNLAEPWNKNGWRDYYCATAYYPLGDQSGVPTNIAYYIESEQLDEIAYLRLTLNINDDGLYKKGKKKFAKLMKLLLRTLQIEESLSQSLLQAAVSEKNIEIKADRVIAKLEILRGATHTLRLIIEKRRDR